MAFYGPDEPDYRPEPPEDPNILSLADHQPVTEGMTWDAWEEQQAAFDHPDLRSPWQVAEDKRAEASAALRWSMHLAEKRRAA